jgi:hypothetical protein
MSSDSRSDRERTYRRVVGTVEHQTSPQQPPGLTAGGLWTHCVDLANMDHEAVDNAQRAAIENGDLVEWEDEEGIRRLSPADPETLKRAVRRIANWDEPDNDLIGRLNTRVQELEADDG